MRVEDKFGEVRTRTKDGESGRGVEREDGEEKTAEKPKKEKKEKREKEKKLAPMTEPMIIVHVNDRLGTKAAIPCLASDPISEFLSLPCCTV